MAKALPALTFRLVSAGEELWCQLTLDQVQLPEAESLSAALLLDG
jgi:hypothetical protein